MQKCAIYKVQRRLFNYFVQYLVLFRYLQYILKATEIKYEV